MNQNQVHRGANGRMTGLDFKTLLAVADAMGGDKRATAFFLPYAEAGILEALSPDNNNDGE